MKRSNILENPKVGIRRLGLWLVVLSAAMLAVSPAAAFAQETEKQPLRVATLNVPKIVPVLPPVPLAAGHQDSEAEARMAAALARPITADYFNLGLGQVLNDLSTQGQIPIILDQAATARLKYRITSSDIVPTFEAPIILKVDGLPLASVLDLVLPGMGLTWGSKSNETIIVTTPLVAENWLEERLYPLENILAKNAQSADDPRLAAQVVGDFITNFVAPDDWAINGGRGEIVTLDNALLIRATRDVHKEARSFLDQWGNPQLRQLGPSATEQSIREALSEQITFDAPEQALYEVLPDMADQVQIPIVLDFYTLLKERIPYATPVGFNVSGASLGAVLELMLDPQELTAVIHRDALLVTSKARAAELMSVRMYDVRSLLIPQDGGSGQPLDVNTLQTILDQTVQPESWFAAGGDARKDLYVSDNQEEVLLFVRQTAAGHESLVERLSQLQDWQSSQ